MTLSTMTARSLAFLASLAVLIGVVGFTEHATPASATSLPDGAAYTWGTGNSGELGNGSLDPSLVPVAVTSSGVLAGEDIVQVSASGSNACALSATGLVACWGRGDSGQLGNGTTTNSSVPVAVDQSGVLVGKTVTRILVLNESACALSSDGLAFCWGNNFYGQLGTGGNTDDSVPAAVDVSGVLSGRTIIDLASGGFETVCAVLDNGSIACWGRGDGGQLGNGTETQVNRSPVLVNMSGVLNGKSARAVTGGMAHTCALMTDATVSCWGDNTYGQLGTGVVGDDSVPLLVDTSGAISGSTIGSINSTAGNSTCAISTTGQGFCWGENALGQLGNGTTTNSFVPVAINVNGPLAGEKLASISAGFRTTCASAVSGKAFCWGTGFLGQLGDGTSTASTSPVQVDASGVLSGKHVDQVIASETTTAARARASNNCPSPSAPMFLAGAYQLGTAAHIEWLRDDSTVWDDSFMLLTDIDMTDCLWSTTIGDDTTAFTGNFDGDGKTISNINVDVSSAATVSVGMFGQVGAGHVIRDLTVKGDVKGTSLAAPAEVRVGGVVGYATGGLIERVIFEGNVTATQSPAHATRVVAGGLVGILWDDTITQSAVHNSTVIAEKGDPYAGGLAGLAQGGSALGTQTWITDSYTWTTFTTAQDMTSSGGSAAGGLIGGMVSGVGDAEVRNSFARGNATVRNSTAVGIRGAAGGIVGEANQGSIFDSFAYVSLSSVNPQSADYLGRIAGYVNSAPTGSGNFWNSDISGPAGALGFDGGATLTGTGASESAMQTMSTFSNAGWGIVNTYEPPGANTWGICEDQSYPYLLWSAQTLTTPGNPCSTTPTITGTATVGQSLTASFSTPLDVGIYRWWRVDAQGNDVPLIDYDETYVVSAADIGSRLKVEGSAFENGIVTSVFSAPTSVVPDPNPPTPSIPAGPPLDVSAVGGDRLVTVSWQAPASSGSFPVSSYQMQASPGGASCVVPAAGLSCVITGLTNGVEYTVRGRALTGAGWSAFSAASDPVTPGVEQTIVITGSREGKSVVVEGVTAGLVGEQVTPWVRFPGPHSYEAGTGVRTVGEDGTFTWQRQTRKKIYVYFRAEDDVRSNRVIIRP